MKLLNSKKGVAPAMAAAFVPLIVPLIVLIALSPIIWGSWKIAWGVLDFFQAPVTGNIPVWVFALGILAIAIFFKRREQAMRYPAHR